MFDQSLSKSNDLTDMLKFLPGVVVQNDMSMQGMVYLLYRIKSDLLERLIKSTMIEPLRPPYVSSAPGYIMILDGYLSTCTIASKVNSIVDAKPLLFLFFGSGV